MSGLRPELIEALNARHAGWRHETLPGDASSRRFHRLFLRDGTTRIVMDYGAAFEGETDDVRLAAVFTDAGLPVAQVLDVLPEAGALIEEDLGDDTLEAALARSPSRRGALYRAAVELAADIANRGSVVLRRSDRSAGPALDEERFLFEVRFFLEHYVGGFLRRPLPAPEVSSALEWLATEVASHPRVLCHRDYHSRNIMVRPDGALALVDIQDARWGPDTYDIASLLRDAYVDIADVEADDLFGHYERQLVDPGSPDLLRTRLHLVAAQRMLKALGTFGYQITVLRRERYRSAVPRTVERLRDALPLDPHTENLGIVLSRAGLLDPLKA